MPPEVHETRKIQTVPLMELGDLDPGVDYVFVLDVSDTTQDPSGTLKRISAEDVLSLGGGGSGNSNSSGSGAPSGGNNGDLYLRTSNLHVYMKISGVWTDMGQLVPST
jgi:hypothetical protein